MEIEYLNKVGWESLNRIRKQMYCKYNICEPSLKKSQEENCTKPRGTVRIESTQTDFARDSQMGGWTLWEAAKSSELS
jgi:hypothetical protein